MTLPAQIHPLDAANPRCDAELGIAYAGGGNEIDLNDLKFTGIALTLRPTAATVKVAEAGSLIGTGK